MNLKIWIMATLGIVIGISTALYVGTTLSFFNDIQESSENVAAIRWGVTDIAEGFESEDWADNWTENGETDWVVTSDIVHGGSYSLSSNISSKGFLTSNDIDASEADNVTVSFWFYVTEPLSPGEFLIETFNGTDYNEWYDITEYPGYAIGQWVLFRGTLSDVSSLFAGSRLRFNTSGLTGNAVVYIDTINLLIENFPPAAPTGLQASAGDTVIDLDWNDNTEHDLWGYNLYRSTDSGGPHEKVNSTPILTSQYTDTNLTNGTTYWYYVTAVDTGNLESSPSEGASAEPHEIGPSAPTNLDATAGDRKVTVTWNASMESGIAGYNLYRKTALTSYAKLNETLLIDPSYIDEAVTIGTTYYYVATAVDEDDLESVYSNEDSAAPFNAPPAAPINLFASGEYEAVILTWSANTEPDFSGYSVYRSLVDGGPYTKITSGLLSSPTYTDIGRTNGTTYYYVVTATDNLSATSVYSLQASATPGDAPPASPLNLTATGGERQVSLDWSNSPEGDLAGYNVYRSLTSSSNFTQINYTAVTNSLYTDYNVSGNVTYYYYVTAYDLGNNESSQSNEASATPTDAPPSAPVNLQRTIASRTVYLTWNQNTEDDMQGYYVYRSLTSGGPYTQLNSLITTNSYEDTGLTNGTDYYYVVTAVDFGGNLSTYSNEVRGRPFASPQYFLNDGFDGTPWDEYFDPGGTNGWYRETSITHSAPASAGSNDSQRGYLASNSIDTSKVDSLTVSFWIYGNSKLATGECWVEYFNGSSNIPQHDVTTLLTARNTWQRIILNIDRNSAPQFFFQNFRLVFNSNSLNTNQSAVYVDDVLVIGDEYTDTVPPAAPTGLTATPGDTTVYLAWNYVDENDVWGYNIYRSETSNTTGFVKINGSSIVTNEYYTDTGRTNGVMYYYYVTTVDFATNQSVESLHAAATPVGLPPAAPTGLTATAGEFTVFLDWNDNTDYDLSGYNVYRSTTSGGLYAKINASLIPEGTSNFTDNNSGAWLTAGTTYYYVVKAVDDDTYESTGSNEAFATPYDIAPAAPTGLTAAGQNRQVFLDWNDNTEWDLAGYNIYRSTANGTGYFKVNPSLVPAGTSNFTDTGLTGGIMYYYIVRAVDNTGNISTPSNQANATPADDAPGAPTGLTATTPFERMVYLDWNDNTETDLAGYNLYRSTTSGSGHVKINAGLLTTSNYTDTGRIGGVTCYYYVKAVDNIMQESPASGEASALVYDNPPAAPTGLTATGQPLQVYLTWNANNTEDDFNSYTIYRSQTDNTSYSFLVANVTDTYYRDFAADEGFTWYYYITASDNASNESAASNETFAAPLGGARPAKPTGLSATPGDRKVTLSWNANSEPDLAGYNLYRSSTSGGPFSLVYSCNQSVLGYIDTGRTGGVTYYYTVKAFNDAFVESLASDEASALVYDNPPATPTNLTADNTTERQVYLNWDDNTFDDDFSHFDVYRSDNDNSTYVKINSSNLIVSEYLDTSRTGGVTYYYYVKAYDLAGNPSANSTEVWTTVFDAPPAAPAGLTATAGIRQVTLNWNANTEDDLNRYDIYRSTTSGSGFALVANTTGITFTNTGLSGGITCYYIINAVDNAGNISANSTQVYATAQSAPPVGLSATAGDTEIVLSWTPNTTDSVAQYKIYRSLTQGGGYTNTANVTTANFTDTGLMNGWTYYYVVTTFDTAGGESAYSSEVYAMPIGDPPDAPTGLTATPGISQVSLNWNDNNEIDLDYYEIYRSEVSGSGYTLVGTSETSDFINTANITNGIRYYYVVKAVNYAGQKSGYSNEANARPYAPPTVLLYDGFEAGFYNWDENGTTDWQPSSLQSYNGTWSAYTGKDYKGALTTDNLDTRPGETLTVSFWYLSIDLQGGQEAIATVWNGTQYIEVLNLNMSAGQWTYFTWTVAYDTAPQYFRTDFRLQFLSSINGQGKVSYVDDVIISIE